MSLGDQFIMRDFMQKKRSVFLFVLLSVAFTIVPCIAKDYIPSTYKPVILESASELDYPPFSLVQSDGSADGFSVDLLKAVTRAVNLDIRFSVGPWKKIKQDLIDGNLDVLPLVSYSTERDEVLDFTAPYLRMHGTIFVRKGEKSIQTEGDLKNREILVMQGDTAHEYAAKENLSSKLILTDTFEEAMRRLSAGKHDAVIIQHLVGLQLLKKLKISNVVSVDSFQHLNLKPADRPLSGFEQKFCIAVPEGNKKLLTLLNEGLAIVISNGVYDKLYRKWFAPILPQPPVDMVTIVTYLLFIFLPILFFMGGIGVWFLKKEVIKKTIHLSEEINERKKAEEKIKEVAHHLGERVKELNCLYSISSLIESGISIEKLLQKTVELIPQSWQYPEITCARIKFEGRNYNTSNFQESIWRQAQDIKIDGDSIGEIEVCFLQEKPQIDEGPFLKEERSLLNNLAEKLGSVIKQKQTEEDLKNSEAQFKKMINKSPLPMVVTDENQDILLYNEKFTESFGYTLKDVSKAEKWWETAYPDKDYREKVIQSWISAIENAEVNNTDIEMQEWDLTIKDRTIRNCEFYMVPLNEFSLIIVNDITDRKAAEKELDKHRNNLELLVEERTAALENSEERFKNIFANMSSGCAIYNAIGDGEDFVFIAFNSVGEKIDKIDAKDLIGKPVTQAFPGINAFGLLDVFRRVWQTGVPEEYPVSHYKDDKIEGWRNNYVFKLPSGEIVAVYDDVTEQKRAEEKLKHAYEFLQTIIDGVSDNLMVINRDYTIAFANRSALNAAGRNGIAKGLTCHQISHAATLPCNGFDHICPLGKVVESKVPERVEHIHIDDKGNKAIVELIASPIFDEKGDVIQIIELSRDITEHRLREGIKDMQLRLSEFASDHHSKELQQVFLDEAEQLTESKIGFFHIMEEDQITLKLQTWSTNTLNNMCTAQGKGEHYLIDKAGIWVDCVKEGRPVIHNDYASLSHKKGLPKGHAQIIRELVVPVFRKNKIVAILGVGNKPSDYNEQDVKLVLELANMAWDIITRKQDEEELRMLEDRFAKAFNSSPDTIMITRLTDGMIIDANEVFEDMYDISKTAAIGKTTADLDLWADITQRDDVFAPLREGVPIRDVELRLKRASGEIFDAMISSDIIHIKNEPCIVTTTRDLTRIKRAEKEKKELESQLQQAQKMESIGTLAGGIAHDFNNILFPILGRTEMLLDDVPEDGPFRDSLNEIYTSSLRARDLVQQILTFSRQGKNELKLMRMRPIIEEVLKLIRSTIPTTISMRQNLNPDCGPVKADPTQIHQIIMNLATNAFHAMEETGGELKVNLKEIELGEYDLICPDMAPGIYVCLTIADTGMGMDKDVMNTIFDPFFTTKEIGRGTGLGLSVVHGIVKSMNGEIQVYSEPGKGTEFHVYLPVVKNAFKKQESLTNQPILGGSERILLVDDEKGILTMEKLALERLGYRVASRTSSIEALEAFRANPDQFDLVITGRAMPKMSGDKLTSELIKIRPGIPILLCTGFSESMTDEKIKSIGIKGILMKPILMKDLSKKIRDALDSI
jgi:PAS domain S-box-containing protein